MGMFDWVHCDYLLPDPPPGDSRPFQTKDLENGLDYYRITETGRLTREVIEYEPVPLDERPPPPPENASWLEKIEHIGSDFREKSRVWVDNGHHGYLQFYTSTGKYGEPDYAWHEYRAKFTDGLLVEIVKIPDARP